MKAVAHRHGLWRTQEAGMVLAGAAGIAVAMTVAAKLRFYLPWSPVPVTLQTFVVLAAGATLGLGVGAGGVALYAALASAGLPVLAGPSLVGPTGGYVLGFVAAAALVSSAAGSRPLTILIAMLAAEALILACGAAWLAAWTGGSTGAAWHAGVAPFLFGDGLKLAAAWACAVGYKARRSTP